MVKKYFLSKRIFFELKTQVSIVYTFYKSAKNI